MSWLRIRELVRKEFIQLFSDRRNRMMMFVFPVINIPKFLQLLTLVVTARYFIDILSGIYLRNLGFAYLWPSMLVLLVMFTVLTFLNFRLLKKEGL